jgi:roadblock/LC7 domain-containing protein
MVGYLKLGGDSETVLGGGSFYTSVAYQAGGLFKGCLGGAEGVFIEHKKHSTDVVFRRTESVSMYEHSP